MVTVTGSHTCIITIAWWFWWWRSKNRILHDKNPQASPRIRLLWFTIYKHPRFATEAQRTAVKRRWGPKCCMRWITKPWRIRCSGPIQMGHRKAWYLRGPTRVSNLMPICDGHNKHMGTFAPRTYVTSRDAWPYVGLVLFMLRWLYSKTATVAVLAAGAVLAIAWLRLADRLLG